MTELLCNYAILRFLPYKDIGEFINVGVVVHFPETGLFDYRLTGRGDRRVRLFFPELDRGVYRAALEAMARELDRHRGVDGLFDRAPLREADISAGLSTFKALLGRREALLHFAAPGTLLADPARAAEELYDRYVERRFARDYAYQEGVMRGQLGRWMREWGVRKHYETNVKVGDAMFHLTLPFVHRRGGRPVKGIKPLDLDRPEPTKVYEHGDTWVRRMRRLAERKAVPEQMLFAVRLPTRPQALAAADEVLRDLKMPQVEWVRFDVPEQLRDGVAVDGASPAASGQLC